MAPELTSHKANKQSDVFSFGLVIFDVHFPPTLEANDKHENDDDNDVGKRHYRRPLLNEMLASNQPIEIPRYDNNVVNDALHQLLSVMLNRTAAARPSAHDALAQPYFQLQLHPHRDAIHGKRDCVVYGTECWLDEGLECGRQHFVSDVALEGLVKSLASEGAGKHNGKVKCPGTFEDLPCNQILDPQVMFLLLLI